MATPATPEHDPGDDFVIGWLPPKVDGEGTVTAPDDLTGCTCGDLTIEGRHRFDGTPCPH